jgi:hypothetical protein
VTVEDADAQELRAIAECARRRRKRWLLILVACTATIGVLAGVAESRFGPREHVHRHTGTAGLLVALAVLVVALAAEAGLIYWLIRSRKGFFQTPLVMGLRYRERRAVLKAVRRGQPPAEATLRAVGLRTG